MRAARESREMCMEETRNGRRKPCSHYLPDAVALRLTWMYDAPSRGRAAGQGLLQKLADALKERREVEFPVHDYRGITYVWEVVRHLEEAMGLPGGVYNFGSENRYNTFDTARLFLRELGRRRFRQHIEMR